MIFYLHQYFSHLRDDEHISAVGCVRTYLVSALSTTNINNNIAIREFGKSLGDDSLSAAEGSRDGRCTSLDATMPGN